MKEGGVREPSRRGFISVLILGLTVFSHRPVLFDANEWVVPGTKNSLDVSLSALTSSRVGNQTDSVWGESEITNLRRKLDARAKSKLSESRCEQLWERH